MVDPKCHSDLNLDTIAGGGSFLRCKMAALLLCFGIPQARDVEARQRTAISMRVPPPSSQSHLEVAILN